MNSTAKSLISNIYKYFKSEQDKSEGPSGIILKKTMKATGLCRGTVYHITEITWMMMMMILIA